MTTLMSDDGTGKSDGTVLDTAKWTTEGTTGGTGGGATYQSTALAFKTGNQGGYAGTSRVTRSFNITSVADIEISGTITHDANEAYPIIMVRATTSTVDYNNGYYLRIAKDGAWTVGKTVSFSGTTLGTGGFTPASSTTYGFRFRVVGTSLKARVWTGSEPGTWTVDITDSTFTSAGKAGISVGDGSATVNHTVTFDNIVVTNGTTDVSLTETTTLADAMSVQAAVPLAETGTLTDGTLSVANLTATQTETMSLVDGTLAVAAAVPMADTGTLADLLTVGINTTMAETMSLVDLLAVSAGLPMGDTGTLADALVVESFVIRHDLVTEIEFEPGIWTDVSEWVVAEAESSGTFGRPTRFDDIAASTWKTNLRNSDGRFTPGNPNSPYYPNVGKGRQIRTRVDYSGQSYPRFWGKITGITLPAIVDVESATVMVQAADIMADLARKTLLSPFVEESRRQALQNSGGGVDVFPFPASSVKATGSVQVADTSFENKGVLFPGSSRMGTVSVMAAANGGGQVKSGSADSDGGVLSEGQLDFEVGDNGFGRQTHPIVVAKPQLGFQQFELFFKIPENVLPPVYSTGTHTVTSGQSWNTIRDTYGNTFDQLREMNPDLPGLSALAVGQVVNIATSFETSEWVLAQFWNGTTEVLRICLVDTMGKLYVTARRPSAGVSFVFGGSDGTEVTIADGKWRKLTVYKTGTNSVRCNINDLPSGADITSMAADLTAITTVYVAGRVTSTTTVGQQAQCPPVSVGGLAFQATRNGVWYWYCLGAPPANVSAKERFVELAQYSSPIQLSVNTFWHSSLNLPFDIKVVRTNITGRSVLDCMQELARTVGGYLWVQPEDGTLTMRKGPNPPLNLATIDLTEDADITNPPIWKDTVDVQPTRITAKCPAGEITSINTAAEAAGQYKDGTVDTCAATIALAKSVADRYVTGQSTLHLTNLQVDLIHAAHSMWSQFLPVFLPTERVLHTTNAPLAIIGYDIIDAVVESWEETYTIDTATFAFETTPIGASVSTPPLASFTVTASTGVQSGSTITASQPAGTQSGDFMVAILTADDTGSLAGMTAGSEWAAQGAGGTSAAGFGKVFTKTAGSTEPPSYGFQVAGTAGTAVLMQDAFTGSNGAALDSAKWAAGETRTGATKAIQSNAAHLDPGTITGYGGRVSINAVVADKADIDIVFSFKQANGDSFPGIVWRGDSGGTGSFGYQFRPGISASGHRLAVVTASFNETILGYIPGSITAGVWYRARVQSIGSAIKARLWQANQTEPSSWGIEVTNTAITAAGKVSLFAGGGGATGSTIDYDDVIVSDPHAVSSIPEAKLTLMRVAGADTSDPMLVAPTWASDGAATTSQVAPSITPASAGLLVSHWHILTDGSGTGGGGGGGGGAFSFGMSGVDSAADITAINAWLVSHNLKAIGHWTDNSVASQQGAFGIGTGGKFGAWTGILDVAMGGIFSQANGGEVGGDTWAHAGSGTYDSRWTTAINAVKAAWGSRPAGNLHLRFAHEWNGSFSTWAVNNANAANFVLAFRRFADLAHTLIPGVQVVWSPNDGTSSLTHVDDGYPGSAYVDVIGPDSYNAYPHVNTLAAWNSKINGVDGNGNPLGIESWRQYALTKGKPLALPEFGNPAVDTGGGAGGGDAPFYAESILSWFHTNGGFGAGQVKYACYFNIGTVGGYASDYLILANGSNGTVHQPLTSDVFKNGA